MGSTLKTIKDTVGYFVFDSGCYCFEEDSIRYNRIMYTEQDTYYQYEL